MKQNRRQATIVLRTRAGGQVDKATFDRFKNDVMFSRGHIIDVYLQQLCFYINQSRGVVAPNRAMLVQPQAFYNTILPPGGEVQGSQQLRAAGVTAAEFAQLEYFFTPVEFNAHTNLIAISPLHHTIELLDSVHPTPRTTSQIYHIIIRFLIHELGALNSPDWTFMHNQVPPQPGSAGCGIFTCLYAKRLALNYPLLPLTNIGQGTGTDSDIRAMKLLLLDDLLLASWTAKSMPPAPQGLGPATARARHISQPSAPQCNLFSSNTADEVVNRRGLRSRTGRFDTFNTWALMQYCRTQPSLFTPDGAPRLHPESGHHVNAMDGWRAWAFMGIKRFVERVEWRTADLAAGRFPRSMLR
jgi:hypothetical protein